MIDEKNDDYNVYDDDNESSSMMIMIMMMMIDNIEMNDDYRLQL